MTKIKNLLVLCVAGLMLSGCASLDLFGKNKEKEVLTTVTEYIYVPVPEELNKCNKPVILTPEQILEITHAQENDDVDSEELFNRFFVSPTIERHETCWKSSRAIDRWSDEIEEKNKSEEENGKD